MSVILNVCKKFLILLLRFYRYVVSPAIGSPCRFHPSCSVYAIEAIEKFGCIRGMKLTLGRLLRCHPWCVGGCDPVPNENEL